MSNQISAAEKAATTITRKAGIALTAFFLVPLLYGGHILASTPTSEHHSRSAHAAVPTHHHLLGTSFAYPPTPVSARLYAPPSREPWGSTDDEGRQHCAVAAFHPNIILRWDGSGNHEGVRHTRPSDDWAMARRAESHRIHVLVGEHEDGGEATSVAGHWPTEAVLHLGAVPSHHYPTPVVLKWSPPATIPDATHQAV